ncbi:glycosyltransferase [Halovulum sp. GXIMD14794]
MVLDTEAQAAFFRDAYRLDRSEITSAFVGAEVDIFPALSPTKQGACDTVLYYCLFIPLHGIATIIEAARLSANNQIKWVFIGTGQMAEEIRQLLKTDPPARLKWIERVSYPELIHYIRGADVCFGVFGESAKAGRVIPNKVFQILSAGRPLVTRDGPGIRELITEDAREVELVPPSDPVSLLTSVERLIASAPYERNLHHDLRERFSAKALSRRWGDILRKVVTS